MKLRKDDGMPVATARHGAVGLIRQLAREENYRGDRMIAAGRENPAAMAYASADELLRIATELEKAL